MRRRRDDLGEYHLYLFYRAKDDEPWQRGAVNSLAHGVESW